MPRQRQCGHFEHIQIQRSVNHSTIMNALFMADLLIAIAVVTRHTHLICILGLDLCMNESEVGKCCALLMMSDSRGVEMRDLVVVTWWRGVCSLYPAVRQVLCA